MAVTLQVTLRGTLPAEREELDLYLRGPAAHSVLESVARELRAIRKYEEHGEAVLAVVERLEAFLHSEAADEGIEL